MSDFETTTKEETVLPSYHKKIILTEGQAIKDNQDVINFANKTVPLGKIAKVMVNITVISLKDA